MAEQTDTEQMLHRLFDQVNQHIETRWAYFSLTATEKFSGIAANLVQVLTLMIFTLIMLFFFSMGFAWWLGDLIGHRAGGFALSGLVFLPIAFFVYRWIGPFVRDKVLESVLHDETEENPKSNG